MLILKINFVFSVTRGKTRPPLKQRATISRFYLGLTRKNTVQEQNVPFLVDFSSMFPFDLLLNEFFSYRVPLKCGLITKVGQ